MAKGIWSQAAEDDPIFTGRLTISSGGLRRRSTKISAANTAGQSTVKSPPPAEKLERENGDGG